ncbi:MAG: acetylxylan esterase, partial [Pedobacter sp.]|nr:acetylxylan esterase [Pedobacter sp.]
MEKSKSITFFAKKHIALAIKILTVSSVLQSVVFTAFSQKQPAILNWKADVSLNTYLVQQMHQQYDARRIEFNKALNSKEGVFNYIKTIKKRFKNVLGELPQKAPLKAQVTGFIEKVDYRIEKIVYQSFENHHITANLYVPKGTGKFPAVLFFCGHEDFSKATESYQQTAILFAKNGFVVLVVDPISQSERVQLTDGNGKALTRGSTTEHTILNLSANLLGTSVAAYELFDNVRSLDYLVTRPEVDINKIGCLGNSGGAMQAIYFAAFDDRIKIVAPCSYLASREKTLQTTGAADGCAQIPNEGNAHLEMSDYLIAAAPKPILVLAGRYDFIDYDGTLKSVDDLKRV